MLMTNTQTLNPTRFIVLMMPSQTTITEIADRIEMAYARKTADLISMRSSGGVWEAAATGLLMLAESDPTIPVDAELFVAVQPVKGWSDPWGDLASQLALMRYHREVKQIIAQLRSEIKAEMTYARKRFLSGISTTKILTDAADRLSPLGRYILAYRAGLFEMAERIRPDAERQHRACPLYQAACKGLIDDSVYPKPRTTDLIPGLVIPAGVELPAFSMN
jgi:hypothetical protein